MAMHDGCHRRGYRHHLKYPPLSSALCDNINLYVMKNISFLLALFLSAVIVSGQTMEHSKDYYLQKGKNQKRTAWILLVGGTTMAIAGSVIGDMDNSEQLGYGANFEVGMWLVGTGIAADLISIPLFISASKNHRTAVTLSLNNQPERVFRRNTCLLKFAPGVTVAIRL